MLGEQHDPEALKMRNVHRQNDSPHCPGDATPSKSVRELDRRSLRASAEKENTFARILFVEFGVSFLCLV